METSLHFQIVNFLKKPCLWIYSILNNKTYFIRHIETLIVPAKKELFPITHHL